MRCGEKRYLVTYEIHHDRNIKSITARTPAEARKKFRAEHGADVKIISVILKR